MDIIDKVKSILQGDKPPDFVEGSEMATSIVRALSDKDLKKYYMGKDPMIVPRDAQEELYRRFVQPHAHKLCNECYGRGHTGWNEKLHQLVPCPCLQRTIRTEVAKENSGYLYDPSGNKITFMN